MGLGNLFNKAAVGVILKSEGSEIYVLFIKRRSIEGDPWAGHIAFPGGHFKEEDGSLYNTVIREVREETGIDLESSGRLVHKLPISYPLNKPSLKVYPYVFMLHKNVNLNCGDEVEESYWVPLKDLRKSIRKIKVRGSFRLVTSYVYRFDESEIVVWGLTKRILDDLFPIIRTLDL